MEFTAKDLIEHLNLTHVSLVKSLRECFYELKEVEGSFKPVKHYKFEDLPDRYKEKLKEQGVVKDESKDDNNSKANIPLFTKKYLLASPLRQKQAMAKCRLVEYYRDKPNNINQRDWLDKTLMEDGSFDVLGNVSIKQLNDWVRKYREAEAKGKNIVEAFVDSRGASKGVRALSDEQKKVAERNFLKMSRVRISALHRNMCHLFGDLMPSYDTLNAYYNEWKRKNPLLYEFAKNPDSAKNKYLASFGKADAKALYKNHYWELDSTPADVICDDGKRYAVLAAIDVFSRRVVFHVAPTSNAYSISQLLRKAILKLGIPENVVIDNGRDYTSIHFESICTNLKINMSVVPPFSGDSKPHVERVFGTMGRELFEEVPGYVGHSVAEKQELQNRKSFEYKVMAQEKWKREQALKTEEEKKLFRDAWKISKENIGLDLTVLLSPDELQNWIDNWVDRFYEQRVHKGINTKPIQKWNDDVTKVQTVPDVRMLDLLLGESVSRKVGKKGISFDGCVYAHVKLVEYVGHWIYVMAGSDLGYVLVYSENMQFICIAEDVSVMGLDRYQVRGAKKRSQQLMRKMDRIIKEAKAIKDVTILDRISDVESVIETNSEVVAKHTPAIEMLLRDSKKIEEIDRQELEKSNRYDFKLKDEEGKATKVLPSGRPVFNSFFDRFVWDIRNDMVDENTKELAIKYPTMWELAEKETKAG